MPKSRQQKEQTLSALVNNLKKAKGIVLSTFKGLTVKADRELRQKLLGDKINYSVVKKTLLKKALAQVGYPDKNLDKVTGNISIAISESDEVAPAKTIQAFSKGNETFKIIGGILEEKWLDSALVKNLAALPSKEELIAKTVGTIKAPLTGFVNVLAGNLRGLINALNAIKDNK